MLRPDQILTTVEMIQKENLDVRTVTMGINLLDCRSGDIRGTCDNIERKIGGLAENFVPTCDRIGRKLGIPVVNKRISVTPIALVGQGFKRADFIELAKCLERAADRAGIDILGGFSAQVEKGLTESDREYILSIPEALSVTEKICASINIASSQKGINMDALAMVGRAYLDGRGTEPSRSQGMVAITRAKALGSEIAQQILDDMAK